MYARKKWLDNAKGDCAAMNLSLVEASRVVEDRRCWRELYAYLTLGLPARKDIVVIAKKSVQILEQSFRGKCPYSKCLPMQSIG